jgi:hypothetical protein
VRVGDLVTLSSRGKSLESCWRFTRYDDTQGSAPNGLVGLVTAINKARYSYMCAEIQGEKEYVINWIGNGPVGRTHWQRGFWHRSDLKFVSKVK